MSSFLIAEYSDLASAKAAGPGAGVPATVSMPLVQEPPITVQSAITLSSSSQASSAFSSSSRRAPAMASRTAMVTGSPRQLIGSLGEAGHEQHDAEQLLQQRGADVGVGADASEADGRLVALCLHPGEQLLGVLGLQRLLAQQHHRSRVDESQRFERRLGVVTQVGIERRRGGKRWHWTDIVTWAWLIGGLVLMFGPAAWLTLDRKSVV